MPEGGRASRVPDRFSPSRPEVRPSSRRWRHSWTWPARPGCTSAHLALAFALTHPAVTSAIIGPRTMEHMTGALGALEVSLSDEVLDRIDAVVPPGTTVDPSDTGWTPPPSPTPGAGAAPWPPGPARTEHARTEPRRPGDRSRARERAVPESSDTVHRGGDSRHHRPRADVRDGGGRHPGGRHPGVEELPGQPARRPGAVPRARGHGLSRLRGRAHHLRGALPHRGERSPTGYATASGSSGRPGRHRHAQPPRVGHGLLGGGGGRRCGGAPERLVDRPRAALRAGATRAPPSPSSTRRASNAWHRTSPISPTSGPWW